MIYMIMLLFLTGLSLLFVFKKNIKVSDLIIYPILLGLSVHTIIFTFLAFLNTYYSFYAFIAVSIMSMILIIINKNYKKVLSIENDLRRIPLYYLVFFWFILYRLLLIVSTSTFDYFNWDELSSYQLVSKTIFLNHEFSSIYRIFTPMNYFLGTMTYEFSGISLVIPRLIMPLLFVLMSIYLYVQLTSNKVNRHISALLSMIFLISSAEMIILSKVFYTNILFTIYFLIGAYGILKHYFIDEKKSFPITEYLILFSLIFIRREGLFLVLGILFIIYFILFITKKIKFKTSLIYLFIPILYKVFEMFFSNLSKVHNLVETEQAVNGISKKINPDVLSSYFQNIYRQTLAFDSYFLNYLIFGLFIFLIIIFVIRFIKNKKDKIFYVTLYMLLFEFMYIGIVVATQILLFTIAEFSIAASFSRYVLMVLPVNFILVGSLLFENSKGEKLLMKKKENNKIKNPKVILIIPAYNEEENILRTYNSILNSNEKNGTSFDVIVINDGSKDNTGIICRDNNIPTINLIHNLGIGGAVQTGYKYALNNGYDIAIQFDGDGQHDIESVRKIIKPLEEGNADMVIGSRFVSDSSSEFKSTKARRMGINLISFLIKKVTKIKIYDTTSGFRACNREVISLFAKSYPTEYPEPITTTELLKRGYVVLESGVKMQERVGGVSSIGSWKNVYYMVNVILSIIIIGSRRYK